MRRAALVLLLASGSLAQTPAGAIHGVVTDAATGNPLPDLPIHVAPNITGITNAEGKYAIDEIPPGVVTITAGGERRQRVTRTLELGDGADLTVDFVIPANASLSGRVLNQDREPLVEAMVWRIQPAFHNGVVRYVRADYLRTGKDGSFRFENIPPGRRSYLLVDRPIPDEPDPEQPIEAPTYYGDSTAFEQAIPVKLRPSEQRTGIEIRVQKSAHYCVEGKIPPSQRFEIRQSALAAVEVDRASGTSAKDGAIRACGLAPGDYVLLASPAPETFAPGPIVERFFVGDSDVHGVQLTAETVPLQVETVWRGDAVSRSGVWVELARWLNVPPRLIGFGLGPSGFLARQLTPGDYVLNFRYQSACCYVKGMSYNGVPVSDFRLHLASGGGALRVDVSPGAAALRCHAVDSEGRPASEGEFVLIPEDALTSAPEDALPRMAFSPGEADWGNLAPGKYRVLALNRAAQIPEDLDLLWSAFSQASPIELAPGDAPTIQVKVTTLE